MAATRVRLAGQQAIVTVGGVTKTVQVLEIGYGMGPLRQMTELPIIEPISVGVRIGRSGQKLWRSEASIKFKTRVHSSGESIFTLWAPCPLNSVNRAHTFSTIEMFWEEVPDSLKSKR